MDWLILLLLVPAIVVPIVLSLGFAGCGFQARGTPLTPTIVSAIPLTDHIVVLTWTYTGPRPPTFEVRRKRGDEDWLEAIAVDPNPATDQPQVFRDDSLNGFTSQPVQPGTRYTYSVRAVSTGITVSDHLSDLEIGYWSAHAVIETYATVFTSGLQQSGVDEPVTRDCVVQRLSPGSLSHGGNLIAFTLRGPSIGELVLSRVTVSRPALGGHDYNSESDPVDLNVDLNASPEPSPVILHGFPYALPAGEIKVDVDEALLVAFDIDTVGNAPVVHGVAHTAYIKKAPNEMVKITEAGTALRSGFTEHPNELWLIDSISIATKWPIS